MDTQTTNLQSNFKRTPGIQDVAEALGMHKSTVSMGLSGKGNVSKKTRERIIAVANEMGYQPNLIAQRLATNATNNQVLLCARTLDIGVTTEKILLLQNELAHLGFEAPIYSLSGDGRGREDNQAHQIRQLCRQQPRAIVCSVHAIHENALNELASYQKNGGILVAYDVEVPLKCDQVIFDREYNAYQAARVLIEAGHKKLGLALSTPRNQSGQLSTNQKARVEGFQRALKEANLEVNPEWIFEVANYETGGAELASHFLALSVRPTGLSIVNDYMALGFMATVQRAGLQLPRDLSVIGHDDQIVAPHCPVPLSCTTHPKAEIVKAIMKLLRERLGGSQQPPRIITIRGDFVQRESIASPLT
jgi:LacI family purine nucleotide synthesis repressor